jgi:hypothetical protein
MMKNMSIDIIECIEDRESWFNIKRMRIGNLIINRPIKAIDIRQQYFNNKIFNEFQRKYNQQFIIYEFSKNIRNIRDINKILDSSDDYSIGKFFRPIKSDNLNITIFTFNFNPYSYINNTKDISGFFDYYYQYSDILFIPNIKISRYNIEKRKQENIIDLKGYLRFVDEIYNILNYKNRKPIFVPISLRFSETKIKELIEYYIKNNYYLYWFDFEGKALNEVTIGKIRYINRLFNEHKLFKNCIYYFTNIKREIISNPKVNKSPASDILATLVGANILGVNKEPIRPIEQIENKLTKEELLKHKARIFDASTYYYIRQDNNQYLNPQFNVIQNTILLDKELNTQANHFINNQQITSMLKNKQMLQEYKDGKLLELLLNKNYRTDKSLIDFL